MSTPLNAGVLLGILSQEIEEERRKAMLDRVGSLDPAPDSVLTTEEKAMAAKHAPWFVKAAGAQEVHDLNKKLNDLQGLELLEAVHRVVALYYDDDPSAAGLVTSALSCMPNEPQIYYASITRYKGPQGTQKLSVAHCKATNLQAAVRGAARQWLIDLQAERAKRFSQSLPKIEEEESLEGRLLESVAQVQTDKSPVARRGDVVQALETRFSGVMRKDVITGGQKIGT